jgi:transmembrane sensor
MLYNEESARVEILLIKKEQNVASPEELLLLEQLIKQDPALAWFYKYGNTAMQDDAAVRAEWGRLEKRMMRSKVWSLKQIWLVAASVLILVVCLFRRPSENTLQIPARLNCQLQLSDGTSVTLNSKTTLKYPPEFSGGKREVYIDGEAYFKVAPDVKHPFIVHTNRGDITVLGTAFNVNTYTAFKTALVSGAVAVSCNNEVIELKPGQELTWNSNEHSIEDMDDGGPAWIRGVLYFHNTPLSEIAAMIERWYGVPVIIDNDKLAAETFTGNLEKSLALEEFLRPMKGIVKMNCYYKGKVLHMSR